MVLSQEIKTLTTPNVDAVSKGLENLEKHIENIQSFNIEPVVAINKFVTDTDAEIEAIKARCASLGVSVSIFNI